MAQTAGRTNVVVNVDEHKSDITKRDEFALNGRQCRCGYGMIKWYFCNFHCDSSHIAFSLYLIMLIAVGFIYYGGIHGGEFFYSLLGGCCLGIVMSIYSLPKLQQITQMRKALRKLVKANIKFRDELSQFSKSVGSVKKAYNRLDDIQNSIHDTNSELKNKYKNFNDYGKRLNQQNVQNIESLKKLRYHFEECRTNYQALLMRAEKSTLNTIYQQIHKSDGVPGLSRDEFFKFVGRLPKHYKKRFAPYDQTFERYAGSDQNMDYREFQIMIKQMAIDEASGM